jgi:hypothetical protein
MVLLLKDPKVVAPFGEIGLLFSVFAADEVLHELGSVYKALLTAHEAEVEALVLREGVGRLRAVCVLVSTEGLRTEISRTLGALYIGIAGIFTFADNGHSEFSAWIFSSFTFKAQVKNCL